MNPAPNTDGKFKTWAWVTTDLETTVDGWKKKFARMREAGLDAVLPEIYDSRFAYYQSQHLPVAESWLEQILPLAKEAGLEVHAWMWSMPCNIEEIRLEHPEWFSVNRNGESTVDKPAYVDYYKFLCPSRPEVQQFIQQRVAELAQYPALDGIHLDYIRYPDVILAEALQPAYGIVQDREYPQYDYCYCEVCRSEFKARTGLDPLALEEPSANQEWKQFRFDRITNLVNNIIVPLAHRHHKQVTAAVFPNWESVRQQWFAWNLDGMLPMLYHNFYNGDMGWIRAQTEKGVRLLEDRVPLYSGLFVPQLTPALLIEAVEASRKGGASGTSLFHAQAMTEEHWRSFEKVVESIRYAL